jgi:hypothetical protein
MYARERDEYELIRKEQCLDQLYYLAGREETEGERQEHVSQIPSLRGRQQRYQKH